jgi:hypothetical protein
MSRPYAGSTQIELESANFKQGMAQASTKRRDDPLGRLCSLGYSRKMSGFQHAIF